MKKFVAAGVIFQADEDELRPEMRIDQLKQPDWNIVAEKYGYYLIRKT